MKKLKINNLYYNIIVSMTTTGEPDVETGIPASSAHDYNSVNFDREEKKKNCSCHCNIWFKMGIALRYPFRIFRYPKVFSSVWNYDSDDSDNFESSDVIRRCKKVISVLIRIIVWSFIFNIIIGSIAIARLKYCIDQTANTEQPLSTSLKYPINTMSEGTYISTGPGTEINDPYADIIDYRKWITLGTIFNPFVGAKPLHYFPWENKCVVSDHFFYIVSVLQTAILVIWWTSWVTIALTGYCVKL